MKADEREVLNMKKKIISAILLATMLLSGCSAPTDVHKTAVPVTKPVFQEEFKPKTIPL